MVNRLDRRSRIAVALGITIGVFASPSGAYVVTTFSPDAFITPGANPTPAETTALDAEAGIGASFTIEDFEDTTLIAGLTVALDGAAATGVISGSNQIADPDAVWDGSLALQSNLDFSPNQPVTFGYLDGAISIVVGISGFDALNELVVNGQNLGSLNADLNFVESPMDNRRNLFVRIDMEFGDLAITEVAFLPDPANPNPEGDFVRFDHFGVLVPEPSTALLLASGLVALAVGRRRRTR